MIKLDFSYKYNYYNNDKNTKQSVVYLGNSDNDEKTK